MSDLIELAKQQAAEIACAGHNGWGNTMLELAAALEAAREDACVALVADIRFACGDNGKRMQPELVEYIRELASGYERMKDALEMMAEQHRCGCGHPHCNNCARDRVCAAALAPKEDGDEA